jgi:hypothetical protein
MKTNAENKKKKSVSETGHNKNAANFDSAYQILEEMGALYQPSNENILLTNLAPVSVALKGTLKVLNTQKPIYKNNVANREVAMAKLPKTITSASNYFKSLKVSKIDKENVNSQVQKLRGAKKAAKIDPDKADATAISTAQLSYDSRIANFDTLTSQLASHPEYNPFEEDIKIGSLQNYHTELTTLSGLVNASGNALITGRKNRNEILYENSDNVIELIRDVKSYVKSLGKSGLPYYKALVRLRFRGLPK